MKLKWLRLGLTSITLFTALATLLFVSPNKINEFQTFGLMTSFFTSWWMIHFQIFE